jgi:hypothetical protein
MSRPNYRRELIAAAFLPVALACVDMGVVGVVASKAFAAPALVVALLEAAPHAAALSSVLWTAVMHGRDRVRFVLAMQIGLIACVALAAAAPVSSAGLVMLVALVIAARCFYVGLLAGRTDLWRNNYPRHARARASGVFTIVMTIVLVFATLALGWTLDRAELAGVEVEAYRLFYLGAAAVACVGVWNFSKVRWRAKEATLAEERRTQLKRPGLGAMLGVLRDDVEYRKYQSAQMVMGAANLAAQVPTVLAVTQAFDLPYTVALAITAIVPKAMMVLAIPLWSRLLASRHIVDFRAIHSWSFVVGNGLVGVGVLTQSVPTLLVARAIVGGAMGGGTLAWSLGHHDFAPRDRANSYMGAHIVLTGIRGSIAPILGAALYESGLGGWTFILCAAGGAVGALMFVRMRATRARDPEDARRDPTNP